MVLNFWREVKKSLHFDWSKKNNIISRYDAIKFILLSLKWLLNKWKINPIPIIWFLED